MSEYLFRCQRGHEFRAQFQDRQPVQCPQCYALSPSKPVLQPRYDDLGFTPPDTGGTGDGSSE